MECRHGSFAAWDGCEWADMAESNDPRVQPKLQDVF
jgi:hypothetical protein